MPAYGVAGTALGRVAAASLPAARAAARKIIGAGGRILGKPLPGAAVGTAIGLGIPGLFGGAQPRRRRRGKGISAAELRGARKVAALVRMYGMKPKSGVIRTRKRKCY